MAESYTGAVVRYCGHNGWFPADITKIGNANVVRANGPVSPDNITRIDINRATHHIVDFPGPNFWRPDLGVFVVPEAQVRGLKAT